MSFWTVRQDGPRLVVQDDGDAETIAIVVNAGNNRARVEELVERANAHRQHEMQIDAEATQGRIATALERIAKVFEEGTIDVNVGDLGTLVVESAADVRTRG